MIRRPPVGRIWATRPNPAPATAQQQQQPAAAQRRPEPQQRRQLRTRTTCTALRTVRKAASQITDLPLTRQQRSEAARTGVSGYPYGVLHEVPDSCCHAQPVLLTLINDAEVMWKACVSCQSCRPLLLDISSPPVVEVRKLPSGMQSPDSHVLWQAPAQPLQRQRTRQQARPPATALTMWSTQPRRVRQGVSLPPPGYIAAVSGAFMPQGCMAMHTCTVRQQQ